MIGKYKCQQLLGGDADHIKQSEIDDFGMCNHTECKEEDREERLEEMNER